MVHPDDAELVDRTRRAIETMLREWEQIEIVRRDRPEILAAALAALVR